MIRPGAARLRGPVPALTLGLLLLVAGVVLSLYVGQRSVPFTDLITAFTHYVPLDPDHATVRSVRVPRTLLAILVGAALAVSGALTQTLTRNPLADPGLLGVTAGAAFAVVLTTWWWGDGSQVRQLVAAAIGAGVGIVLVYGIGRTDPLRLVLAGAAVTAVLAGLSITIRLVDTTAFENYRFWEVGSLSGREQLPLVLPAILVVVALLAAVLLARALGALSLGDEVAHGLGVSVFQVRVATLTAAMLATAVATAVAGPIVFVGLIVPHLVRTVADASVPWLVALSLVFGPVLLLVADVAGRLLLPTGDVPVGIMTALVGGPVLIAVVRRAELVG